MVDETTGVVLVVVDVLIGVDVITGRVEVVFTTGVDVVFTGIVVVVFFTGVVVVVGL